MSRSKTKPKMLKLTNRHGDTRLLSGHLTLKQLAKRGIMVYLSKPGARLKEGEWRHVL